MSVSTTPAAPADDGNNDRAIARRASASPMLAGESQRLPARIHRGEGLIVRSELELWIEPKLYLSWSIVPSFARAGYSLLLFHSTSGFCPERYPENLNQHGALIVEATEDGSREEHPVEGNHFYTFVLQKKGFLTEKLSVVRLSETVPTAKIAIGRIRDRVALEELLQRDQLNGIEHESRLIAARMQLAAARRLLTQEPQTDCDPRKRRGNSLVDEELANVDQMVKALVAKRMKIDSLKDDAEFNKLSDAEQQSILDTIEQRLDAAELSARREQRGE